MAKFDPAAEFGGFLTNLELTTSQRDDALTKAYSVGKCLHSRYYANAFDGSTILVGGSYLKATAIRPPSDIDVLFFLPLSVFERFKQRQGNVQSQLLQEVKGVLQGTFSSTDLSADGQIVLVPFATYRVELLPVFFGSAPPYWYPDTNAGGRWGETHPKEENAKLSLVDGHTKGDCRRLLRMLKAWKRHCSVPVKSMALELQATQFCYTWEHAGKGPIWYDWMSRDFLVHLIKWKDHVHQMPGTKETISVGNVWEPKASSALTRARAAIGLAQDGYEVLARMKWQEVFGAQFGRT